MKLGPESIESIKLFNWIRSRKDIEPYTWHVANERTCSPQEGRILKRMGVKKGVSDYIVAIPSRGFHGLFIELKVGNNKPSEEQQEFLDNMTRQGYLAACVWGYEAAREIIETYLSDDASQACKTSLTE